MLHKPGILRKWIRDDFVIRQYLDNWVDILKNYFLSFLTQNIFRWSIREGRKLWPAGRRPAHAGSGAEGETRVEEGRRKGRRNHPSFSCFVFFLICFLFALRSTKGNQPRLWSGEHYLMKTGQHCFLLLWRKFSSTASLSAPSVLLPQFNLLYPIPTAPAV